MIANTHKHSLSPGTVQALTHINSFSPQNIPWSIYFIINVLYIKKPWQKDIRSFAWVTQSVVELESDPNIGFALSTTTLSFHMLTLNK